VKCNGTYDLQVQTLHGEFTFRNQKFHCLENGSSAFLQAAQDCQSAVTQGLESLAVEACVDSRSYEKARKMLARVTGTSLMTCQTLCNWVQKTALRIDKCIAEDIQKTAEIALPPLASAVDLYDPSCKEINLFEDGILVDAQKPTHEKQGVAKKDKEYQFHQSFFSLAPRPDGSYQFVMSTSNGKLSLSAALFAFVCQHWRDTSEALNLVAITDGAKDLRADLRAAFGIRLVIILDWYHLRKKVCEICSMLVSTKEARTALKKQLLKLLFQGKVAEAQHVLSTLPVQNAFMHNKLVVYLNNHADEIIDYKRRAQAKKTIGSGRMEKGVDQVIGLRQKDHGMSWSKRGSYALGMATAYLTNGNWDQLWNTSQMAA
jgi:hypothetical protein